MTKEFIAKVVTAYRILDHDNISDARLLAMVADACECDVCDVCEALCEYEERKKKGEADDSTGSD